MTHTHSLTVMALKSEVMSLYGPKEACGGKLSFRARGRPI